MRCRGAHHWASADRFRVRSLRAPLPTPPARSPARTAARLPGSEMAAAPPSNRFPRKDLTPSDAPLCRVRRSAPRPARLFPRALPGRRRALPMCSSIQCGRNDEYYLRKSCHRAADSESPAIAGPELFPAGTRSTDDLKFRRQGRGVAAPIAKHPSGSCPVPRPASCHSLPASDDLAGDAPGGPGAHRYAPMALRAPARSSGWVLNTMPLRTAPPWSRLSGIVAVAAKENEGK